MRGKHQALFFLSVVVRITPADAGKTPLCPPKNRQCADHPRGCGENLDKFPLGNINRGSPPRMRGKHQALFFLSVVVRITPADAGKTEKPCRHFECAWDHPRGCGENRNRQGYTRSGRGSPPRMRGKPHSPYISPPRVRITPADAGKTGISFGIRAGGRDHPRGCGENVHSFRNRCTEVGSPPRMRGKHPRKQGSSS